MAVSAIAETELASAVAHRLRRLAQRQRELERLQADMEGRIEEVRRSCAAPIAGHVRAIERLGEQLRRFCERNRDHIVSVSQKSLQTPAGKVGWRTQPASVLFREGCAEQEACALLQEAGRRDLIRVRETPDKQAIKKAYAAGVLTDAQLRAAGLAITEPRDEFYFQTSRSQTDAPRRRER